MKRYFRTIRSSRPSQRRLGFTTPAAAVAMIVTMFGLALIVDRIWLETAKLELTIAAESACLAACGELASDSLLLPTDTSALRINNALQDAGSIAAQNMVAGAPLTLNIQPEGDVLFGNLVQQPQGIQFVESSENPTTVVVTALRTHSNNNPVATFLSGIVGISSADVAVRVEGSINNDVIGVRPIVGSPIPMLPLSIWEVDPTGSRLDTWDYAISSGMGADQYSFDSETRTVVQVADGIPELVIHSQATGSSTTTPNIQLLDLGTGLGDGGVTEQIQNGVSFTDLQNLGGEILIGQGVVASFNSSTQLSSSQTAALQNLIGQTRLCLLYSTSTSTQQSTSNSTANCTEVVAVRILTIDTESDGSFAITVQPAVMTTRTTILASENAPPPTSADALTNELSNNVSDQLVNDVATNLINSQSTTTNVAPNPYVYKLRLTH